MNTTIVVIAIVAALALLGVVAVTLVIIAPEAEAGCERGQAVNNALEGSKGKCFDRGTF
jgi:uncharacterized membrane protein YjgN (DUF898 family)